MNSLELMEILKSKQSQSVMFDYTTLRLIFEDKDYIEFHRNPKKFTYTKVQYKTLSEIVNKNKGIKAKFNWTDLTFKNGDTVLFTYRFFKADLIKSEKWEGYIETLELKVKAKKEKYQSILLINKQVIAIWETTDIKYLTQWEFE